MIKKYHLSDSRYLLLEKEDNYVYAKIVDENSKRESIQHIIAIAALSDFYVTSVSGNLAQIAWQDNEIENTILQITGNTITVRNARHLINQT